MNHLDLGRRGEYLARVYLEERGYEFIRANFKTAGGEIDLIMRENDEIVFLEVKTRTMDSARRYGRGSLRIDHRKKGNLARAAEAFLREETRLTKDLYPRFDAIELYIDPKEPNRIRVLHTPCAFGV